ncbi:MAG: prepilin-type N-terminal cleavage/methylation domain-containing protein [Armatimonadetes bacterium]|nr:prepilin-type N-terminal cleavage/methylation domain-containing protein [Armatimonadota bacterium]
MLSRGKRTGRRGFTLIEIMIVVTIIGILLSVAIPNFVKARNSSRSKGCVANLKLIDSAKEQFMMDNRTTTAPSAFTDLSPVYIKATPICPSSGTYTIGDATTNPTCSISTNGTTDTTDDHVLSP